MLRKFTIFIFLIFTVVGNVLQAQDTKQLGCIDGDCSDGWGTFVWSNGSKYIGHFVDGQRTGYGYYYFFNGDQFIGDWKENQKHGNGTYWYATKGLYKKYIGEWNNGARTGVGLMYYQDGTYKFGMWAANKFIGQDKKTGCLEGDCHNGYGVYVWADGSRYAGNYSNGKRNGYGLYYYPKGGKYAGYQKDGARHGLGIYYYPSGNKYVGDWNFESKHGEGMMFTTGKVISKGKWQNGKFAKAADIRSELAELAFGTQEPTTFTKKDNKPPVIVITRPESLTRGPKIVVKSSTISVGGTATDDSGISEVRINGKKAALSGSTFDSKGFSANIDLAEGQNEFWVEAVDNAGNSDRKIFKIVRKPEPVASNTKPQPSSDESEQRTALIIGNASYTVSPLKNPVNDATAMADKLKGLGFKVILHTNIEQNEMKRAIHDFGLSLKEEGGVGLFYYAGHGLQTGGQNYLVPVSANIKKELDIELESIRLQRVLNELEYAGNRLNIVILDACRDNPYSYAKARTLDSKGLAPVNRAPIGTFIAYATAPGQAASDGEKGNGLYTQELLNALEGADGLKIEDIFKQVRTAVRKKSGGIQIPWENSSIEGDFYFRK